MPAFLIPLFGLIGNIFSGLTNMQQSKADVLKGAISTLGDVISSDNDKMQAASVVLAAEANSSSWLARTWRPMLMMIFAGIVLSFWFGYQPPGLDKPMSPMMGEIFDLLKLGMGGYIGGRTFEKVISSINLAGVIKTYLASKKLL